MKKLLFVALVVSGTTARAQSTPFNKSIQATIDYMRLDAPDDAGLRYGLRLAHHFGNDRLLLAGSAGYIEVSAHQAAPSDVPVGINFRQRFTADLSLLYDVLRSNRQALRIGGGPSAWYRRDNLLRSFSTPRRSDGTLASAAVQREKVYALNIGYHLTTEYEYLFKPKLGLTGRVSWADLNKASISWLLGVGVSYRFALGPLRNN